MKYETNAKRVKNAPIKSDQVMIDRKDFESMKRQLADIKKDQAPNWAFLAPDLYWFTKAGTSFKLLVPLLLIAATWGLIHFVNLKDSRAFEADTKCWLQAKDYEDMHPSAAAEAKRLTDAEDFIGLANKQMGYPIVCNKKLN